MKAAGPLLLCLVAAGVLPAAETLPGNPAEHGVSGTNTGPAAAGNGAFAASARLKAEIRAGLPAYSPPPPRPLDTPAAPVTADPDVLELPKITVQEKRIPTNDPDMWRSERAIQQRAMRLYKDSMTPLEWAMNCWFVPLFSAPPSARARAAYRESKMAEELGVMAHLAAVAKLADPKAAATDTKAVVDMERAGDWQNRPAGGK